MDLHSIIHGGSIGLVSAGLYNYLTSRNVRKRTAFFYAVLGGVIFGVVMRLVLAKLGINHG